MSLGLTIVLDIVIGVLTILFGMNIFNLISCFKVTIPFTNQLIEDGIIDPVVKTQLILSSLIGHLTTFIIYNGIILFLAYLARPSGFIVYCVAAMLKVFLFKPTKDKYTIGSYTMAMYANKHSVCMDMDKFNEKYGFIYYDFLKQSLDID